MTGKEIEAWMRKVVALFPRKMEAEAESHLRRKCLTMDFNAASLALDKYRETAQGKSFFINEFLKNYTASFPKGSRREFYRVHWRQDGYEVASRELYTDLAEAQLRAAVLNGFVSTNEGRRVHADEVDLVGVLSNVPRGTIRDIVGSLRQVGKLSTDPLSPRLEEWSQEALRKVAEEFRDRERRA